MNPAKLTRTSAFRLTLLFAGLALLCVIVLFGVIELYVITSLRSELKNTVSARLSSVLEDYNKADAAGLALAVDSLTEQNPGSFALLQDGAGQKLAGNLPARKLATGWLRLQLPAQNGAGAGELHTLIGRVVSLPDGNILLVAQDAFPVEELAELIGRAFAIGAGVTLVLSLAGGFIVSRRVLRRLSAIGHAGQDIMGGDLSRRLPVRGTGDELDQLVSGFNALLDRIEVLMDAMRQVTADIAHDLRTPLSRMRARLEQVRRMPLAAAEYEAVIDRTISETDSLHEIITALLRIAQLESTAGGELDTVDAGALVDTAFELYQPLAEERGQKLTKQADPLLVRGDRELLIQMLANLVENACRHTPCGSRISIGSFGVDGTVALWVQDNGPGIPEQEREKVFRRFYRLETSRTTIGSGLGLSLAAAIAARHGGRIQLNDAHPGLRAEIHLPRVAGGLE